MIEYTQSVDILCEEMLEGFFVGWPHPPSRQKHLEILKGSYSVWLAIDCDETRVVGFITSISDGILSAYIPLLEVLPGYQGLGIGKELVSRMLATLSDFYMVDLLCDESLQSFYGKFDMRGATGFLHRNYARQNCE